MAGAGAQVILHYHRSSEAEVQATLEQVRRLGGMGVCLQADLSQRAEIGRLFPECDVRLRSVTLAPPLARRVVPLSRASGVLLESIPLLRTHFFGVIRKYPGQGSA